MITIMIVRSCNPIYAMNVYLRAQRQCPLAQTNLYKSREKKTETISMKDPYEPQQLAKIIKSNIGLSKPEQKPFRK